MERDTQRLSPIPIQCVLLVVVVHFFFSVIGLYRYQSHWLIGGHVNGDLLPMLLLMTVGSWLFICITHGALVFTVAQQLVEDRHIQRFNKPIPALALFALLYTGITMLGNLVLGHVVHEWIQSHRQMSLWLLQIFGHLVFPLAASLIALQIVTRLIPTTVANRVSAQRVRDRISRLFAAVFFACMLITIPTIATTTPLGPLLLANYYLWIAVGLALATVMTLLAWWGARSGLIAPLVRVRPWRVCLASLLTFVVFNGISGLISLLFLTMVSGAQLSDDGGLLIAIVMMVLILALLVALPLLCRLSSRWLIGRQAISALSADLQGHY